MDLELEQAIRAAMFAYLDDLLALSDDGVLTWEQTARFPFGNETLPMRQTRGRGIHKPRGFVAALSITTAYTPPGQSRPYDDEIGPDGYARYKYERTDPNLSTNQGLRFAMELALPMAYFDGVAPARYRPSYPVYVIGEEPQNLDFVIGFSSAEIGIDLSRMTPIERAYAYRATRQRLHQPRFREQVMRAYRSTCAICGLRHAQLLDAAHILEDSHSDGDPVIQNGIALCKIHHTAFDRFFIGIDPDCTVHVNRTLLEERDGPMLKHGLQEMNGRSLIVPRASQSQPDPQRLEVKYERFRQAA
jgi:putative restriction endonuclease